MEHEFIRGNRDGPHGRNETYTVCRLRVAEDDLKREMAAAHHPRFHTLSTCWDCPAHVYLKDWIRYAQRALTRVTGKKVKTPTAGASVRTWIRFLDSTLAGVPQAKGVQRPDEEAQLGDWIHFINEVIAKVSVRGAGNSRKPVGTSTLKPIRLPPPPAAPAAMWQAATLDVGLADPFEMVQRDPDRPEGKSTFTVCRLGVPRETLVREVDEGLHPGYHVCRRKDKTPFVQGNPTQWFDNVNHPESRGAEPGFSTKQLCPMRLIRPGTELHAS
jgi:hypothetical protein